jgi:hypothetical protein
MAAFFDVFLLVVGLSWVLTLTFTSNSAHRARLHPSERAGFLESLGSDALEWNYERPIKRGACSALLVRDEGSSPSRILY